MIGTGDLGSESGDGEGGHSLKIEAIIFCKAYSIGGQIEKCINKVSRIESEVVMHHGQCTFSK